MRAHVASNQPSGNVPAVLQASYLTTEILWGLSELTKESVQGILGMEFFGEVQELSFGGYAVDVVNELKFILLTNEPNYRFFVEALTFAQEKEAKDANKPYLKKPASFGERCTRAIDTFGVGVLKAVNTLKKDTGVRLKDIHVFPIDWRKRLDEISRDLPGDDEGFMVRLAGKARPVEDFQPPD